MTDPISSGVQEVLDLFTNELALLRFGDLDPDVLSGSADEVRVLASAVARAEAELDSARAALAEKQDALLQKAQRALAYARVYAEHQPELASRIEGIALPRAPRRSVKLELARSEFGTELPPEVGMPVARRPGRPKKHQSRLIDFGDASPESSELAATTRVS
jgi:hypothetical protein